MKIGLNIYKKNGEVTFDLGSSTTPQEMGEDIKKLIKFYRKKDVVLADSYSLEDTVAPKYDGIGKVIDLFKRKKVSADFRGLDNEEIKEQFRETWNNMYSKYHSRYDWVSKVVGATAGVATSAIVALAFYYGLKEPNASCDYNLVSFLFLISIPISIGGFSKLLSDEVKSHYKKSQQVMSLIKVDALRNR